VQLVREESNDVTKTPQLCNGGAKGERQHDL